MNLQQVAFWLNIYFNGEIRDIFTESRYYFRDWLGVAEESGVGVRRVIVGILEREVVVLEEILLGY